MNRNSHYSKGSSVNPAPRWRTVFVALVLVIGSAGQIPSAQAAPAGATSLEFSMKARKEREGLVCLGELVHISVNVYRKAEDSGDELSALDGQVTGVDVKGLVQNPNIGQLSPNNNTTIWAGAIYPGAADFIFTAQKAGETIITFRGLVVTPGWFGTDWGGGSQAVSAFVHVQVVPCKYEVTTISNYSAQGVTLAAIMDGEMKADEQGNFTGSGTVNWVGGVTVAGDCSGTIDIASSQADLTGSLDDSEKLAGEVTYLPAALTHAFCCGGFCSTNTASVTPNAVNISVASSGGVSTHTQDLYEPNYYSFHGSVNVVVIPVEEGAVAFKADSWAALDPIEWLARLWMDNFPSLFSALLALN